MGNGLLTNGEWQAPETVIISCFFRGCHFTDPSNVWKPKPQPSSQSPLVGISSVFFKQSRD